MPTKLHSLWPGSGHCFIVLGAMDFNFKFHFIPLCQCVLEAVSVATLLFCPVPRLGWRAACPGSIISLSGTPMTGGDLESEDLQTVICCGLDEGGFGREPIGP